MKKLIIISTNSKNEDKYKLANYLSNKYDLDIADTFTSSDTIDNSNYIHYNIKDIMLSYKNNALLYCLTNNDNSHIGITMDEYYNKNIFIMPIGGLLNIPENRLVNTLVIWIDQKINSIDDFTDIKNSNILMDYLDNLDYMYFNEDIEEIQDILDSYMIASDEEKLQIIENNK
jgi:hypothetical protein